MKFMRRWLTDRREPLTVADMEHARHAMKGMASEEQLARLAGAKDTRTVDRLPRAAVSRVGHNPRSTSGAGR